MNEWFQKWFKDFKSPTLKTDLSRDKYYHKAYNTFIVRLSDIKLNELKQLDIQRVTNELFDKGYTSRSVREGLGVLRQCLDVAVINEYIKINPCTSIILKNDNKYKEDRRVLSVEEQKLFLSTVEKMNGYYLEVYKFMLLTGVRIGELSGLQWNDINFENQTISINRTLQTGYIKGKKIEELSTPKTYSSYRTIPFFSETESVLKTWKKKQDIYKKQLGDRWRANPSLGDLVFTTSMGSPCTRYVIQSDLRHIETNINNILMNQSMIMVLHIRSLVMYIHTHLDIHLQLDALKKVWMH